MHCYMIGWKVHCVWSTLKNAAQFLLFKSTVWASYIFWICARSRSTLKSKVSLTYIKKYNQGKCYFFRAKTSLLCLACMCSCFLWLKYLKCKTEGTDSERLILANLWECYFLFQTYHTITDTITDWIGIYLIFFVRSWS